MAIQINGWFQEGCTLVGRTIATFIYKKLTVKLRKRLALEEACKRCRISGYLLSLPEKERVKHIRKWRLFTKSTLEEARTWGGGLAVECGGLVLILLHSS